MKKAEPADFNVDDYLPTSGKLVDSENQEEFTEAFDRVREQLAKKLVIGFLGTASSGKTSGIKALFSVDLGNIHPIPGSTKAVKVMQIDDHVFVVDAPGFGDIHKEVSQKAKEACDQVDIFIYVLNAQGGYKQQEKEDYQTLFALNREVLVVLNKIDTIMDPRFPEQLQELIQHTQRSMGVDSNSFADVAFDPNPFIAKKPINLQKVRDWIQKTLEEKGKDLLFAKVSREKDRICDTWIHTASTSAAATGAVPIPGSDIVPITAIQIGLIYKIASIYGHEVTKKDALAFITQTFTGQVGKQIFRWIITSLKAAGWIPIAGWITTAVVSTVAATIAGALTYGVGQAAKAYYKSGLKLDVAEIGDIFTRAYNQYSMLGN